MLTNEFYRGLLVELSTINKIAQTTPAPVVTPSIPKPAPMPKIQQPLNMGINSAPSPAVNTAVKSWQSAPPDMRQDLTNTGRDVFWEADPNNFSGAVDQVKSQFMQNEGLYPDWYNNWRHPIKAWHASNLESGLSGLKSPEDVASFLQTASQTDPGLSAAARETAQNQLRTHINGEGITGLAKDYFGGQDSNQNAVTKGLMNDDQVHSFANRQGMTRAGNIVTDFLKNNWGKLAAGGGLAALLAYLMHSSGGQQQQPPAQAASAQAPQPSFF